MTWPRGRRAFTGIARAVWHLSRDGENKARRLLLPGKNNLAREGDGLAFTIGGDPPAVAWERGPVRMTADDAVAVENAGGHDGKPGPEPVARNAAADWLAAELEDYAEHPVQTLRDNAKAAGLGWRTVERARTELGVLSHRATFGGGYVWRLPRPGTPAPLPATLPATSQESGGTWQPGGQGETPRDTADSARQVPLPAKSISPGEQGENGDGGEGAA